jgi:hypothetical protein
VSPVTSHEVSGDVTIQVAPPGEAVTVYEVAAPPDTGAEIVTVALPSPVTAVGAPGVPGLPGVTELEAGDAADVPPSFVAVAVNVYSVLFVKPVTTQEVSGDVTVQVAPPGEAVTVYEVGVPPDDGGVIVTVASPSPGSATGAPGVPGVRTGVIAFDGSDEPEVPPPLVAVAVNVYSVPFVRPETTQEVAGAVTVQVSPPGLAATK